MKSIHFFVFFASLWRVESNPTKEKQCSVALKIQQVETRLSHAIQIAEQPMQFTIAERMAYYRVPAVSIAVINGGRIEWAKAYGQLAVNTTKKADNLTLFQAASISKPVAALAALQLVDQGKVDLDENVNQYLKSWKVKNTSFTSNKPVTLRRLLTHTAGLTVSGFNGYPQGEAVPSLDQILDGAKPANSVPIVSDQVPSSAWRYSGGGYTVMQKLVEDVTGNNLATLMDCTIFSAIGMKDSTFEQSLPNASQQRVAAGHLASGEKVQGNWNIYPESAAAGLWTTPSDLALYAIELQNSLRDDSSLVLSKQMSEKMLVTHLNNWGLGPEVYSENESLAFGHTGSNLGYKCLLFAFARTGQAAVVMTNSDNGMDVIDEIIRSIAVTYNWPLKKPVNKTLANVSAAKLSTFVGTYLTADINLSVDIRQQDNHLLVRQLWDSTEYSLFPESDQDFFIRENAIMIRFESLTNGTVSGLILANLTWTKIK